jgi:pimeloyl-ACP methyl ester carboxylesterase
MPMEILQAPGAHLAYDVVGAGPVLVLIPGVAGLGAVFRAITPALSTQYQVLTHDRRGFSGSHLDEPPDDTHRFATVVDDVQRLIEHRSGEPATVFGNSSGALVALEVLTRYPGYVQRVAAHEPPAVKLLPDAAQWLDCFDTVYATYRAEGIAPAMRQFANTTLGASDHLTLDRARCEHAESADFSEANTRYWLEHELRTYPRVELHLGVLAAHAKRLILMGGRDPHEQMTYQPGKTLAHALSLPLVDMPGAHPGFMTDPPAFAAALLSALDGTGQ